MTNGISNLSSTPLGTQSGIAKSSEAKAGSANFADTFKQYLGEVTDLQQQASEAVRDLTTGQTSDLAGVMGAIEKSDLAFKTLVAIRSKLMTAYEELRNMPI